MQSLIQPNIVLNYFHLRVEERLIAFYVLCVLLWKEQDVSRRDENVKLSVKRVRIVK